MEETLRDETMDSVPRRPCPRCGTMLLYLVSPESIHYFCCSCLVEFESIDPYSEMPEPESPRRAFFERTEPILRGILRLVTLAGLAVAAIEIARRQGWWS